MKIIHVNEEYFEFGGTEVYLNGLIKHLEKVGVENIVVHGERNCDIGHFFPSIVNSLRGTISEETDRFRQLLRDENPDRIHIHNIRNVETIRICAEFAPTIRTFHDARAYCPGSSKFLRFSAKNCSKPIGLRCFGNAYFQRCSSSNPRKLIRFYRNTVNEIGYSKVYSKIIVASKFMKKSLGENGYDKNQIDIVPYFTDLPEKNKIPDSSEILFLGRINRLKGVSYLLDALKFITSDFTLKIGGDGRSLEKYKRKALKLGLSEKVQFLGWLDREQKSEQLENCRFLVVPSIWDEPFGIVGLEAMAHSRPVVAFDVGGISDWLTNDRTGYLISPYNLRKMAEKMDLLLQSSELPIEMGSAGREEIEKRFLPEHHVEKLLRIYSS